MSFYKTIEEKLTEAVDHSLGLNEASLKVSNFTGKIADKAGFKMKKVGDSNPGASVILTGDEKAIISYAKRHLGAEGDSISEIQPDLIGGPGCHFEEKDLEEAKVGDDCSCCGNKIDEEGKCGCGPECKHCGGQHDISEAKKTEDKLDAVGKEDDDVDNDGDSDSTDDYLKKRRAAIGKAIDAKKLKEMAKSSKLKEGADPSVVAKFAKVTSNRPYYVMTWAKEKGIDTDKAMEMAGYKKGSYMGAGAYNWHYDPPK